MSLTVLSNIWKATYFYLFIYFHILQSDEKENLVDKKGNRTITDSKRTNFKMVHSITDKTGNHNAAETCYTILYFNVSKIFHHLFSRTYGTFGASSLFSSATENSE